MTSRKNASYPYNLGLQPIPLLVFCGARGCGKDTAAQAVSWDKSAFADNVKGAADLIFGVPLSEVHGSAKDEPLHDTLPNAGYMLPEFLKNSQRAVVRDVAESLKAHYTNRYLWAASWLNTAYRTHLLAGEPLVLTDMRFPEEEEIVRTLSPLVIHIDRDIGRRDGHVSDVPIKPKPGDYIVNNDGTVEELHAKVLDILNKHMGPDALFPRMDKT